MNEIFKYQVTSINNQLLLNQVKLGLNDKQLLVIIKLLSFNKQYVDIVELNEIYEIDREIITQLSERKLIEVKNFNNSIVIDVLNIIKQKDNEKSQLNLINADAIDRISFLLNRSIKPYELEKLKSFVEEGFTIEMIEVAIQKSVINGVDNFNYIYTVLKNNPSEEKSQKIEKKVKRNINIY